MTSVAATQFLPSDATAVAASRSLVVSLHDIAPSNREISQRIISDLARHGVRVCSLLVVPDYHRQGPIGQDPQFVSWLSALESVGNEIVIHGYFHERTRRERESLVTQFLTQLYTQGEGEFFDLDYHEALRRITQARDEFRALGLKPRGFIAPAWLLGFEAERAARDANMEYTTRLGTVRDLRSGEGFSAKSLVYSVRNQWRRATSLAWNAGLRRLAKFDALLRLNIHPVDYSYPAIWAQTTRFIDEVLPMRTPTTYQNWIAEQRSRATGHL